MNIDDIDTLGLTCRTTNVLKAAGIFSVSELSMLAATGEGRLLRIDNLGRLSSAEIYQRLFVRYHSDAASNKQKASPAPKQPSPRRDLFAAAALQGLLANANLKAEIIKSGGCSSGWIETSAWGFADEMLKAETTT